MQTPAGFWQKVQIEYHKSNTPEKRDFCFQEVAGETSELFDPTNDRHHALSEEMKGFLLDSNGVLIVASAKPDSTSEKEVINDFLELLYRSSYDRPILFLLTKFDEVSANFANEVEAAKSIYTNAIGLLSQDSKSSLLPFSIGTVIDGQIAQNMSGTHIPPLLEWMEGI